MWWQNSFKCHYLGRAVLLQREESESSVAWSQKWWTSKSGNVNFYFSYFCVFVLLRFLMSLQMCTPLRPYSRFHFLLKQEKLTSVIIEIISAFLNYSFMEATWSVFFFCFFFGSIRIKMTFGSHNRCFKIFLGCKWMVISKVQKEISSSHFTGRYTVVLLWAHLLCLVEHWDVNPNLALVTPL